jgi:hypothetical protein
MAAMVVVTVAPAYAKNIRTDRVPPYGGPPIASGRETVVTHCNNESIGGEGATVENRNFLQKGGGDCPDQFP